MWVWAQLSEGTGYYAKFRSALQVANESANLHAMACAADSMPRPVTGGGRGANANANVEEGGRESGREAYHGINDLCKGLHK